MKTSEFSFDLPPELIAQHPASRRTDSRMLVLDRRTGLLRHHNVIDLPELLPNDALVVLNDSRVRKARVYGRPEGTSQEREFLFLRSLDASSTRWVVVTPKARKLRVGRTIRLAGARTATVVGHEDLHVTLELAEPVSEEYFAEHGHVPLPPYIRRSDAPADEERYQTVYADRLGSVAAPTAGLHLTEDLLGRIEERGIDLARVTLHVGLGTFLPVHAESIEDHVMHAEEIEVSDETARRVNAARAAGRPVIAVGTTSVRTLESAAQGASGRVEAMRGQTRLFITPGYQFRIVDGLLTNFHTPESTLLMLVSAFAGREHVLAAYREAVQRRYRFFSYGDAMLIL